MDSLQDILGKKDFAPPDEIGVLKEYVRRKYGSSCSVTLKSGAMIVSVPNAGLAATLQLERQKLIRECGLKDMKLVIRNGR